MSVAENVTPITVVDILEDEVGRPEREGSANHSVPFRLSVAPDEEWKRIFLEVWDEEDQNSLYQEMRGKASIEGDTLTLHDTTMDVVHEHHLDTLHKAIVNTNTRYQQHMDREASRDRLQAESEERHDASVKDFAPRIKEKLTEMFQSVKD